MTSEIVLPQGSDGLLPRDARRGGRAISRAGTSGIVRRSVVDIETDVTLTKTDSLTAVTGAMMADVTRVAQAQAQLELLAPASTPSPTATPSTSWSRRPTTGAPCAGSRDPPW